ncbi:MAG: transglycosylase domain-containing protein, partial [Balneolaceae bacterium]
EAALTALIELFWTKERILEVYLNIAEFGPGVFGVGTAADSFFGTDASYLTPEQSAQLAAVLPSPKRMRVEPPSPYTHERSRWILRQMTQLSGVRYLPGPELEEGSRQKPPELDEEEIDQVQPLPELEFPDSNTSSTDSL